METQEALIWNNPKAHTPGEAIFVPRPGGTEEDAGVLLSVVLNGSTGTSYLLCLDARTMTEMGRAEVGMAIGFGFHGVHHPV
jgi:torulene dioxygenase